MKRVGLPAAAFAVGLIVGGAVMAGTSQSTGVEAGPGVDGIGGVFFKAEDPAALRQWYERHLGIDAGPQGVNFFWRTADDATRYGWTVWSVFSRETEYFGPASQEVMINYRVRDLDALLARLETEGVGQIGETEDYWYGRFAWIADGEGNRVELWEPAELSREEFERRSAQEANP